MDHFESIVCTVLEAEGYWVRRSFKVNLTKQEKRDTGKHSIPLPEIDILAMKVTTGEVLAIEVKPYFDSPGVKLKNLDAEYDKSNPTYKLITSTRYRQIVFARLQIDLQKIGTMVRCELRTLFHISNKIITNEL